MQASPIKVIIVLSNVGKQGKSRIAYSTSSTNPRDLEV